MGGLWPWLLAGLGLVALVAWRARSGADPEAARRLRSQGALLVDVRTPAEFAAGHLEGAVNLPLDQLAGRASELDRARPVVVYCRSGARSAAAARLLRSLGVERVEDLGAMSNG